MGFYVAYTGLSSLQPNINANLDTNVEGLYKINREIIWISGILNGRKNWVNTKTDYRIRISRPWTKTDVVQCYQQSRLITRWFHIITIVNMVDRSLKIIRGYMQLNSLVSWEKMDLKIFMFTLNSISFSFWEKSILSLN